MIGDREYWNKGYGVEAINALLDIIFNRTSLERVYLNTLNWNTRAQKCFKKCGFVESSKVERDGSVFLLMLIHRHEWEDLRSQNSPQKTDIAASE
jgi:RimJ/RimL family protein N-acetyltransferase